MPVENNGSILNQYIVQRPISSPIPNQEQSIPEEMFQSEGAQSFHKAFPDGLPESFYQNQSAFDPQPGYSFLDDEPSKYKLDFKSDKPPEFDLEAPPVIYDPYDPRSIGREHGGDPQYDDYIKHNRRELVNNVRSNLRTKVGNRGATALEATIGLAHIATGGEIKRSFDTSGFIPRSKISISATVDGDASIRFKMPLGGNR